MPYNLLNDKHASIRADELIHPDYRRIRFPWNITTHL